MEGRRRRDKLSKRNKLSISPLLVLTTETRFLPITLNTVCDLP